jgi:hypothetical protein
VLRADLLQSRLFVDRRGPRFSACRNFGLFTCRSVLLAAAFVFVLSGRSQAAPLCGADSLTNYLSLGSCSIGGATFSNFSLVTPLPTGAAAVPTNSVIVLPFSTTTSVGFQFLFDVTSTSFQLNELLFGYLASAAGFTDATLSMPGATATGDGSVTAIQDVCIGGAFATGSISGCPATQDANVAFAIDGDQSLSETLTFASVPLLGIVNDIAADGGLNGLASLRGGITNSFTVVAAQPVAEPATVTLLATGLAWALRARARRRQI